MTAEAAVWLYCPVRQPDAAVQLLCLPHAGGSASFFRSWVGVVPNVEIHAARYPGRAERIQEPPPNDLRQLAAEIATAAFELASRPIALFGHSLGAPLALETARVLEAGGVRVVHLFASGSRNDAVASTTNDKADDPIAVEELLRLGGLDPAMADDDEFLELVLPYIGSDGEMFSAYSMDPEPLLHCPVTTIVGDDDDDADRRPWSTLTMGPFRQREVPGNHFYLIGSPPFDVIGEGLDADSVVGSGDA